MTTDTNFVHPAHDPPAAVVDAARGRVDRTIRRRRQRRRATGSAALVALVVAGAAGIAGLTDDDGGDVVAQGGDDAEDGAGGARLQADTEWSDAMLSRDGRTLMIQVGHSPPGDDPCAQNFEMEVVETDTTVTVAFDEEPVPALGEGEACTDILEPQVASVSLDVVLGDRALYDGIRPEPRPVHRLAEVVEVGDVPDGFTNQEPQFTEGQPGAWQQMFLSDGADWYFTVAQDPEGEAPAPEGTPTPVTVHGIEGLRYTGQMNGTMESIRWDEGGLTITVWGEMQGPPTFTRSAELLEIAEGVRLPDPTP